MLVYKALDGYAAQAHKMLWTCICNQTLNYKVSAALLSPPHAYIKDYVVFIFWTFGGLYFLSQYHSSKSVPE